MAPVSRSKKGKAPAPLTVDTQELITKKSVFKYFLVSKAWSGQMGVIAFVFFNQNVKT